MSFIKSEPMSGLRTSQPNYLTSTPSPTIRLESTPPPALRTSCSPIKLEATMPPAYDLEASSPLSSPPDHITSHQPTPKYIRVTKHAPPSRMYRQTRAAMRTPLLPRLPGLAAHNFIRIEHNREAMKMGLTPSPGELGVPNGARMTGSREAEGFLLGQEGWKNRVVGMTVGERELRTWLRRSGGFSGEEREKAKEKVRGSKLYGFEDVGMVRKSV